MNSKTSSRFDDSLSSTKNDVNDGLSSSSSSNRNHEVNNNDENEVFVDEVDAFEPSSPDEAFAFSTSLVVSLFSFVAARIKELKKLNINVII